MISIIIPTLNEEKIIADTLGLLRSKLTIPHEIIVSDGKSTDKTVEISRSLADKVVEYTGTTRQTIAQGRNHGARAATGDILVFMDADCSTADPDHFFSKIEAEFRDRADVVGLCTSIRVLRQNETFLDFIVYTIFNNYLWIGNNLFGKGMAAGELQAIRKSTFDKLGGYNEKLVVAEDFDMFQRLAKVGKIRFEKSLVINQTGRRAHKVGWFKLLRQWHDNYTSMRAGKSHIDEWEPIR